MRPRSAIIVIAIGIIAVALASVLSMYPSVSEARDLVEDRWQAAQPRLDERYERLASLSRAVRAVRADVDLLDDVDEDVADWKTLTGKRPTPDVNDEPQAANRAESAGARLARFVTTTPSLRENADVVIALHEYLGTDPTSVLEPYGDAVDDYDSARSRFPGRFFASLLGFEGLSTVEVPGALDDLDVPEPPPPPTTTATAPDDEGDRPEGGGVPVDTVGE